MGKVLIRGLLKQFAGLTAVDEIDLDIAEGEFVTLLGPSGCGKTTTLRCVAGLEPPTAGRIEIGGQVVADPARGIFVPPEKRNVGMVFQNYALWPHMTVFGNVAYPLKLAKVPKREIAERVEEILDRVGLAGRSPQLVTALSGGQQQRVALARAIVNRPRLVFFDEPLSNLDAKLRYSTRQQIRALHDAYGMTSVYVTHDQEEAISLADRIVVMRDGVIEQIGNPRELYTRPATAFVADFMGYQNIWDGVVAEVAGRTAGVRIDGSDLVVRAPVTPATTPGNRVRVAFRGGHVKVAPDSTGDGVTRLEGTVLRSTYLGSAVNVFVDLPGGVRLRGQLDETDAASLLGGPPEAGAAIALALPADHVVVLPAEAATGPDPGRTTGARSSAPVPPAAGGR